MERRLDTAWSVFPLAASKTDLTTSLSIVGNISCSCFISSSEIGGGPIYINRWMDT